MSQTKRPAFTLVELLVAMAIIMAVAALVVYFIDWRSKDVVTDGANQVLGWLSQARERALRDEQPVGLRLSPDSNGLVSSVTFISATPDWTSPNGPGKLQVTWQGIGWTVNLGPQTTGTFTLSYGGQTTSSLNYNAANTDVQTALTGLSSTSGAGVNVTGQPGGPFLIVFTNTAPVPATFAVTSTISGDFSTLGNPTPAVVVGPYGNYAVLSTAPISTDGLGNQLDFSGGFAASPTPVPLLWPIQVGDYLELGPPLTFAATVFQITSVGQYTLGLVGSALAPATTTTQYTVFKIIRQARVYSGEPPLALPNNIVIDVGAVNRPYPWYNVPLPQSVSTFDWIVTLGTQGGSGSFTLTVGQPATAQTTSTISSTATAAQVQSALASLTNVGGNGVTVTGAQGGPYAIVFTVPVGPVTANFTSLGTPANAYLTPNGPFDILFTPAGALMPNATTQPVLYLWLRDTRDDTPANTCMFGPHERVVAVYPRTGDFSSLQVDPTLDPDTPPVTGFLPRYLNPFSFAQVGQ